MFKAGNQITERAVAFTMSLAGLLLMAFQACAAERETSMILSCKEDNDLYRTLQENKIACNRYDTPAEAVDHAGEGTGVLILADGYPEKTTVIEPAVFEEAAGKKLRLYVEYPSFLPGVEIGAPKGTHWERAVIASDAFAPALAKLSILAIHGCRFVPLKAENPHIGIGTVRVTGTVRDCQGQTAKIENGLTLWSER